jgi:hypothetical protein
VSDDAIAPLGADLPDIAHSVQDLMPTARASRHGVKLVHVPAPGQFAFMARRLKRAVVADAAVLKCPIPARAVLFPEERPKECAINLVQALVQQALIEGCRSNLPYRDNSGGEGRRFGRRVRTAHDLRKLGVNAKEEIVNGHGYPCRHEFEEEPTIDLARLPFVAATWLIPAIAMQQVSVEIIFFKPDGSVAQTHRGRKSLKNRI